MNKHIQIEKARFLRKEATKAEKILWEEVRNKKLGVNIRRQHPVGAFVLDFYCPKYKVAFEIDGSNHLIHDGKAYDKMRTYYLQKRGIRVYRFFNSEVIGDKQSVLRRMKKVLQKVE